MDKKTQKALRTLKITVIQMSLCLMINRLDTRKRLKIPKNS